MNESTSRTSTSFSTDILTLGSNLTTVDKEILIAPRKREGYGMGS